MNDYTELIALLRQLSAYGNSDTSLGDDAADAIAALVAERDALKTVMVAAAEEIATHWDAHCDAEGYGPQNLLRRLEYGIPSEYGYTAGAVTALVADAERYRWLIEKSPEDWELRVGDLPCWKFDWNAAIDAARAVLAAAKGRP